MCAAQCQDHLYYIPHEITSTYVLVLFGILFEELYMNKPQKNKLFLPV